MHTLRGAALLRRYLTRRDLSLYAFCQLHALDRIAMARLIKGERKRVSVDVAHAIERATEGAVPMAAWVRPARSASEAAQ